MQFEFLPLRFEFVARDRLHFPPGKAGNILRGAFGTIFRRAACLPECLDAHTCSARERCLYARVFEPVAAAASPSPSGLSDPPRPFVFRANHLDGRTLEPGQEFHFDLNIFLLEPGVLAAFVRTFAALAHEGLGSPRARVELQRALRIALHGVAERILYDGSTLLAGTPAEPAAVDLDLDLVAGLPAPRKIRVDFLSPTELKHNQQIVSRPEFPVLFRRIRDRISTLAALYGSGPLPIDFQRIGARSAAVRMTACRIRRLEFSRHSTRTGQTHKIGGFVGFAEYEGELAEFLPYLEAARWAGVGRQAVWGKGEIAVKY